MGLVIGTGGIHIGTSGGGASPVKRFDAEAEYIKRKAGGTDNIGTGKAKIPALKGKSLVWNQLIQNGNFVDSTGWLAEANRSISVSNGVIRCTCTAISSQNNGFLQSGKAIVNGHKYYLSAVCRASNAGTNVFAIKFNQAGVNKTFTITTEFQRMSAIQEATATRTTNYNITYNQMESGWWFEVKNTFVIDLTLMFGTGHEPSTVEEFEAMYHLLYYDHNPGEIINNEAEAIETVGFNQWDEEWEVGTIHPSGRNSDSTVSIRSKNLIPAFPNTIYCYKCPVSSRIVYIFGYDAAGNKVWDTNVTATTGKPQFTTPDNVRYLRFTYTYYYQDFGNYRNDICINLSDPAKNGTYKPYEKHTLQLGLNSFDVKDSGGNIITVNGLKSAGSAYDEIDLERGKYIKRIGVVDMGSLSWNRYATKEDRFRFIATDLSPVAEANTELSNIEVPIYSPTIPAYTYSHSDDKVCGVDTNYVYVVDNAYTDKESLKTALSGVKLYYALAEPVEYDLVTPIGNSYKVISGGTEERLPRDTASSVMAPIKYSVKYVQPKE